MIVSEQNLPHSINRIVKYFERFLSLCELRIFFTPIPSTYTSLLLDGWARNYYFLSTRICKSTQFVVPGSILFLPPYTQGEKKKFGLSWNQTQVLLLTCNHSNHWTMAPRACELQDAHQMLLFCST